MAVPFYRHALSAADAAGIAQVLDSPILTSGNVGKAVEAQMAEFFSVPHALLVNSWTNGALAVLLAHGIGPGDEVIVPALTFSATANVVQLLGATVVFADVDPATLLLTAEEIQARLTPRTRAVIPVHLYGQMCDMQHIAASLRDRPDILVIEDAAHCFEGERSGTLPGQHSDGALFSFYATKNVTCGEGGALVTRSASLAERVRQTRLHGMTAGAIDRHTQASYRHWDMDLLGVKANLPDLLAALLPGQIASIRERLTERERLAARYNAAFGSFGVTLPRLEVGVRNAWHLFVIHVPPEVRDLAISRLNERGIGVAVNFRAVPTLRYYRAKYGFRGGEFPHAEHWGGGVISLPFFPGMTDAEQDEVIETVRAEILPLLKGNPV